MSSILKALKKLEHDKISAKQTPREIDSKILQDTSPSRLSKTTMPLIAIMFFMCGGGATYFYLKTNINNTTTFLQTVKPHNASVILPPTSSVIAPGLKKNRLQIRPPVQMSPKSPPVIGVQKTLPNNSEKVLRSLQPEQRLESVLLPEPTSGTVSPIPSKTITRPILTVNGIAFQEGGNDNMAVINGTPVSIGTVIDGVTVEEIQKDRIRFRQGNDIFEIILKSSKQND